MLNAHLSTDFQNLQITRRLTCDAITLRDKSQFIFPFLTDWNDATQCVVFEKRNFQNLSFKDSWIKNCGHWKKNERRGIISIYQMTSNRDNFETIFLSERTTTTNEKNYWGEDRDLWV